MIDVVLWIVRVAVLGVAGWLIYWFAIRIQLLLNYAEQLLEAARVLLALAPGKSAARTVAPDDVVPKKWWKRLLPDMVPADDPPPEPATPTIPAPARTDTDEMDRVDIEDARDQATGRHHARPIPYRRDPV